MVKWIIFLIFFKFIIQLESLRYTSEQVIKKKTLPI